MTKEMIAKALEEDRVEFEECPGCPCEGGCEFCPDRECTMCFIDGIRLTEDDRNILYELVY